MSLRINGHFPHPKCSRPSRPSVCRTISGLAYLTTRDGFRLSIDFNTGTAPVAQQFTNLVTMEGMNDFGDFVGRRSNVVFGKNKLGNAAYRWSDGITVNLTQPTSTTALDRGMAINNQGDVGVLAYVATKQSYRPYLYHAGTPKAIRT